MTVSDVKNYYKTSYQFRQKTGMSASTFRNWIQWGFVPIKSQITLQQLTKGALIANIEHDNITK